MPKGEKSCPRYREVLLNGKRRGRQGDSSSETAPKGEERAPEKEKRKQIFIFLPMTNFLLAFE